MHEIFASRLILQLQVQKKTIPAKNQKEAIKRISVRWETRDGGYEISRDGEIGRKDVRVWGAEVKGLKWM